MGASRVPLPDTLSLTKRSELSASTPEDETFVLQKDLTTQKRAVLSPSPVPNAKTSQLHSKRTEKQGVDKKQLI